jgi:hypothetical protein
MGEPGRSGGHARVRSLWPWLVAAGLLLCGWFAGAALWGGDQGSGYRSVAIDWFTLGAMVLVGAPTMAVAGWLTPARGLRRVLGLAVWAVGCLAMTYVTFFAWFGGFCIDPGDVCETTWTSRLAPLAVALLLVGSGFAVSRRQTGPAQDTFSRS